MGKRVEAMGRKREEREIIVQDGNAEKIKSLDTSNAGIFKGE